MPTKPTFSPAQLEVIRACAKRVYQAKFAWMRRTKENPGGQEAMALALGITQQSVSNLLKGTYNPGWKVATNIANLDGQTLDQLLSHIESPPEELAIADTNTRIFGPLPLSALPNLKKCVDYHEDEGRWAPWTIAAAQAGFFGEKDFPTKEWENRLDRLQAVMEKGRK